MPADFPSSPTLNQTYTFGGRTWSWNGTGWQLVANATDTLTLTNGLLVPAASASAPSVRFGDDTDTGIYSPGANQLAISTGGTGTLFLDATGRVGVGASPASKLDVTGAITAGNSPVAGNDIVLANRTGLGVISNHQSSGAFTYGYGVKAGAPSGTWLSTYGAASLRRFAHTVSGSNGFTWLSETASTATSADSAVTMQELVRINPNGRMGIGTSTPDALLTVNGVGAFSAGTASAPSVAFSGNLNTGIYSPGADQLAISTGGTNRVLVDAAGNITIAGGGNILADFSNTTVPNRTYFQTTTTNGSTTVGAIPNGTNTASTFYAFNDSDPTNSAYVGPTISNTAAIIRSAITGTGTLLPLTFEVGSGSETARFDTAGRLLVGVTSTAATANTIFQGSSGGSLPAVVRLAFNSTAPADGNGLGQFLFTDSGHTASASITAIRDGGTWTSGTSQPTRFVFGLAADGSTTVTEQLRITNGGVIAYNQATPISKSAAATLTVAELQNAIINYTGAAATLTLPTGTLTEAGFSGVYTNLTFEWSVINTGSGTCTIGAGTGHTITGSATIAVGASGRFASRRTAANTFVSYRLA